MARCDWVPYYGVVMVERESGRVVVSERLFRHRSVAHRVAQSFKKVVPSVEVIGVVGCVGRRGFHQQALFKRTQVPASK